MMDNILSSFRNSSYRCFIVFGFLTISALTGCATTVSQGQAKIGAFTVDNTLKWSKGGNYKSSFWTRESTDLNYVRATFSDYNDNVLGSFLSSKNISSDQLFSSDDDINSAVEKFLNSWATATQSKLYELKKTAQIVSGQPAIEVEFEYFGSGNLRYRMQGVLVINEGRLMHLFCRAPVEFYFPKYADVFEGIISSAQLN